MASAMATAGGKLSRLPPHPKYRSVASSSHGVAVPLCKGGAGFQGVLDLREKIFLLNLNTRGCLTTTDLVNIA